MKNEPTPARSGATIAHRFRSSRTGPGRSTRPLLEVILTSPVRPPSGQSFVTRRAIGQIVRAAVSTAYGVTGLADNGPLAGLLIRLGIRPAAVAIRLDDGLQVELRILVAAGIPIAEVARQVDSVVRYAVRQAIDREIGRLTIVVGGLRVEPAELPDPKPGLEPAPTLGPEAR
jgi:uncharacterized alkaline shock family protein YloU